MVELRYSTITPPTAEPVSLVEARAHLKIDDDDTSQDATIGILISAARRYAESYTGRSLMSQTLCAIADAFPGYIDPMLPWGGYNRSPLLSLPDDSVIKLMRGPVTSITSITYVDTSGTTQTLASSQYIFDSSDLVQRIAPAYGFAWPASRQQLAAVKITFVAGYTDAPSVPATFKNWILVRIATAFEHRQEEEIVARGKLEPLAYVDTLLDSEKVWAL